MTIRGIIFDMDGVLCDSEPFICEAAVRMFRDRHGTVVQEADFLPFVGAGEDRYLGGVAEKYGVTLALASDKAYTYDVYLQIIRGRLQPLGGVHAFIRGARAAGMKLALATSADAVKMEGNLREIGLPAAQFDATVNGLEVVRKKPHPDIFLEAARRLGLPAADCVVVEDAENGVRAAKAAGAACLGLTSSFAAEKLRAAGADWTAPDLAQVPAAAVGGPPFAWVP